MCRRILLALFYSFLFATCACVGAAQDWVEVKSPHFSVVTDAGEKRGRQVADRFEQMRTSFGILFNRVKVNIPVPLQIIAFRNSKGFRPFEPLWKGKPVELAGLFQGSEDRNFIAVDLSTEGWGVVFHEYAHLLINGNSPRTPVWFDEGFAEYVSSLSLEGKRVLCGWAIPGRVSALKSGPWFWLADLFAVKHGSRVYNETDRRSIFYAESWIVVHYLMASRKMAQAVEYMTLTEQDKVPIEEAIRRSFHMEPKQLDEAVHAYFRSGRLTYFYAPAPEITLGPYESRRLAEAEWQAILADFHYHSLDHRDEGIAEFKQVLAKDPDNAAANRGLGYAALRKKDFDNAGEYFRRAAARDSSDPRVHYFAALLASRRALESGQPLGDTEGMRRELQAAISLNPNYADAYNLMAQVEAAAGKLDAARAAADKAVDLDPRNEFYQMTAAQFAFQARDWDAAEKLLTTLKGSNNASIASAAQANLQSLADTRRYAEGASVKSSAPVVADTAVADATVSAQHHPPDKPSGASPQPQAIQYLKGKLVDVDCSRAPVAVLHVMSGGKLWNFTTRDTGKVLLIGEDAFSCSWRSRTVSINYRIADGGFQIVSLEPQ